MRMGTSSRPITGSKRGSTRLSCCGEAVIFQVAANMRASSGMWSLPGTRIAESEWRKELAVMKPLSACRLEDYREYGVPVGPWSTVRVGHNTYSVPSRLIRHEVVARLYADKGDLFCRPARGGDGAHPGRGQSAHRLSPCNRIPGPQTRRLRTVSLPGADVSFHRFPAGLRPTPERGCGAC